MLNWSAEELRAHGYAAVDALVALQSRLATLPVAEGRPWAELEGLLGAAPPEQGRPFEAVLEQALTQVLPNNLRVSHPRFFAYVPGPSNPTGAIAELLMAGFNTFAGTAVGGAAAAVIEQGLLDWLVREFGLGPLAGGVFVSGGSHANLTALAVARDTHPRGHDRHARVYLSDQTHHASTRALKVLGFEPAQLVVLPSDVNGRLEMASLRAAVAADPAPFCVIANAGTTSTGAADPLGELAAMCQDHGLWLHVDAAYGGAAVLCEAGRAALRGIERADSVALDPHKWLFQPVDLGCVLVRDARWLEQTFGGTHGGYMNDVYRASSALNFCDRGIELTRPFRALKLWMSLQHFGVAAFRAAVAAGITMAQYAESLLRERAPWELVTPAQLGVVTFRHAGDDALQEQLADRLRDDGFAMVHTTLVRARPALRMCLINPRCTQDDVAKTLDRLEQLAATGPVPGSSTSSTMRDRSPCRPGINRA